MQAGYRIPSMTETRLYVPAVLQQYLRYRALETQQSTAPSTLSSSAPHPLITAVLGSGESATVGKPFHIKVIGVNAGGYSPSGGIAVSFPDHPAARAGCKTDSGACTIYFHNAAIAIRSGQEVRPAAYPLVESWHQHWYPREHHVLEIILVPQERGILRLFVLMALQRQSELTYVGYPTTSAVQDQQHWEVESYVIPMH
jgi:hypothetical protein